MTVDSNLKKYVDDFFENLTLYDDRENKHHYKDLLKASIDVFLDYENDYNAFDIYENFFMIYQITPVDKSRENENPCELINESNTLVKLASIMKDYEENTGNLIEKQRDHFIHSVNVFLLGLAVYSQNQRYRELFSSYIKKNKNNYEKYYRLENGKVSHEEFLYRWGIAALFHDIGYPVEIIGKELKKYIADGIESISDKYDVNTAIQFKDFKEFNSIVKEDPDFTIAFREDYPETNFLNLYKPTDIMAHKIFLDFNVDVEELSIKLNNFIDYMGEKGFIDHGYFSAILVLNTYAELMQKHYKERDNEQKYDYFFYPIVDSATAILLHNYYRNAMQEDFNQGQMEPSKSPISYLLILCDELQEWNRKPLGIKNRKHAYVNEMKIEITDEVFNIDYIVKNGSVGLGFKEDKESLLKTLLNINALFGRGLNVYIDLKFDLNSPLIEAIPSETETPNVLIRHIEKIAEEIHNNYKKQEEENGNNDVVPYSQLEPIYKKSNIRQAKSYPYKLNVIGCEIVPESSKRKRHEFTEDEIEYLAKLEHEDWCNEKINTGWISHHDAINPDVMGEDNIISQEEYEQFCECNNESKNPEITPKCKDDERRIHADLVNWDELSDVTKEKDREPIRKMPEILFKMQFKIVKTKIRLLSIEMHRTYKKYFDSSVPEFEKLPKETKYSNYKQTAFLVKMLSEEGYKIVSLDAKDKAISSFTDDEIEHFAKLEHENWYEEKFKTGLVLCPKEDDKQFNGKPCSKHLVPWDKLDSESKEANRHTFRVLPKLCEKVGLKIIKIKK